MISGAGEMAQSVRWLLCDREDLSSDPQHSLIKLGVVAPVPGERRPVDPGNLMANQYGQTGECRAQ